MDRVTSLENAINYAKNNPNDPKSIQLKKAIQSGKYNAELAQIKSKQQASVQPQEPAIETQSEKKGILKSLISAPATILARPIQLGAELLGASSQKVNEVTKKLTGDIVAPVPESGADVKKDAGRVAQTVALGLNPVAGGALFGAGHSVEQGNDLLSAQTAFETVLGGAGGKLLETIGKPIFNTAGKVVGKITPQFLKDLAGQGGEAIAKFASEHDILPENASNLVNKTADKINNLADAPFNAMGGVKDKATTVLSRANTREDFGSSVDRLNNSEKSPMDLYNKYAEQEAKFKVDSKQDMAISKVGEDVGNAYESVAEMRRKAGAKMSEEMKAVGNVKTDLWDGFVKLEEQLAESGVAINPKTGRIRLDKTSKMTQTDAKLINDYIDKVKKLGGTPTASELDAFLSRTAQDLKLYKTKNGILHTTNGERIIKANLKELGSVISEKSNPIFKGYSDAKSQYAELSTFLEQGQGVVGKKTASGDYTKDASSLKSSVNSVLNNGKKDWLIKLEELTGEPILDKTVIALQAMKDSGNAQAESLLNLLAPNSASNIPTSKAGILNKIADTIFETGKKKILGSPVEQTRRVIQERIDKTIPKESFNKLIEKLKTDGGGTINLDGTPKELGSDFIVSVRSKNIPADKVTPEMIQKFKIENQDLIQEFGDSIKIGLFKLDDKLVSIDLNLATDAEKSIALAKLGKQQSVFDEATALKTNFGDESFVQTGFDGKNPEQLTIEKIKSIIGGKK